ncbi:MAG: amidohydrolase [Chloroflexi bacterium]|nr:amidohydrolase [Chloroflexota bacterium]|tara:strand:- start:15504 stop:16385 length:882 start_codon:yes stop_codon:yes gene_type:complete
MQANNFIGIDSHQHFWDIGKFSYPWMSGVPQLKRNFLPQDLKPHLDSCGISKSIIVQADTSVEETIWLLEIADNHDFIAGVVGWVDLESDDVEYVVEKLSSNSKLIGIRHLVHDEIENDWILRPKVIRGLKVLASVGLSYDLLVRPVHLKFIPELMELVPDLRAVVDHIAKPNIFKHEIESWESDLEEVAKIDGIYCKFSGMVTEADYSEWSSFQDQNELIDVISQQIAPYAGIVKKLFGIDRLIWGSDWPVCTIAVPYEVVYSAALKSLGNLNQQEKKLLLSGNAMSFYRLS